MQRVRLFALVALLVGSTACDQIQDIINGASGGLPEGVEQQIRDGDLPAARPALEEANKANPADVEVATYLAYTQMMAGEYDAADATLAAAEENAGDALSDIKLRRALVGLRARNLDAVLEHAKASNTAEGKLLAAEVHIVDLETNAARPLLNELESDQTVVGETARKYLEMLNGGSLQEGLAEVAALWALGERQLACDQASEIIPDLEDTPEKVEMQLLWAGRALTSGRVDVANSLVSEILDSPDPSQVWRLRATNAQIAIAQGEYEKGLTLLEQLEEGAPADGLADARATACALAKDKEIAVRIAGDLKSNAIAWCLHTAGAPEEAKKHAVDGTKMKEFLETR